MMGNSKINSSIKTVTEQEEKGVYVAQFKIQSLAIFTYYVESQKQCYIIDPTYDYLFYKDFIQKRGATLKFILLTHYHADFISSHGIFNVPVIMGDGAKKQVNKFMLIEMKDNQKFKIGNVQTRVMSTPGHTPESACFILANQQGKEFCIFTGDTVFLREVGRPDLAVSGNVSSANLAEMLYESIQKIKALDSSLRLYPGHGSGSACGKSIGSGNFCDLKTQGQHNYAFLINNKQEFVEKLTKDLSAPPKYFFYDAKINQQGPQIDYEAALNRVKKPLSVQQFEDHVNRGITVVDSRDIAQGGLIKGSFWLAHSGPMCNLASTLADPQKQFVLLTPSGKQEEVLQRFLRIGFLNILGYGEFKMQEWKGQKFNPQLKKWEQISHIQKVFIDVRNKPEWIQTGVMEGALTISLSQVKNRIKQVQQFVEKNKDKQLIINCRSGMRARLASSILLNNGVQKMYILNEAIDKIHQKGVKLIPFQ